MLSKTHVSLAVLAAAAFAAPIHAQSPAGGLDEVAALNLEAQPLDQALTALGQQLGLQIIVFADDSGNRMSRALRGDLTGRQALEQLLAGTGLVYRRVNESTIAVGAPDRLSTGVPAPRSDEALPDAPPRSPRQVPVPEPTRAAAVERTAPSADERMVDTIVVTGTRIRGANPTGSPLLTVSAEDILNAGYATASDVVADLPQNFGGDASPEIITTDAGGSNISGASGVNLRGLGASATLTLVNGRRLARSGGTNGSFADISSIPVSAIERVEILTDGASAIYGSDAIAGVVNFILKDDYEGAETRVQVSDTSQGGAESAQFSQSFGTQWGSGNLFANYEFYTQENLGNEERVYSRSIDLRPLGGDDFRFQDAANPATITVPVLAAIPTGQDGTGLTPGDLLIGSQNLVDSARNTDLMPEQERQSLYVHINQDVTPSLGLFAELRASKREFHRRTGADTLVSLVVLPNHPNYVSPPPDIGFIALNYDLTDDFGPASSSGDVTTYTGVLGAEYDLPGGWHLEGYASYVVEDSDGRRYNADRGRINEALGTADNDPDFDPAVDGYFNPFGDGSNTPQSVLDYIGTSLAGTDNHAEGWSVNVLANGDVFTLPGGAAKLAVGAERRREEFGTLEYGYRMDQYNTTVDYQLDRDISATFAELFLPIVGEANARPGLRRLEASVAVRYEHYSDFGDTTNPKLGLAWVPFEDLTVRGSWGTSFKAPRLSDVVPDPYLSSGVYPIPDPTSPTGLTTTMLIQGTNTELEPESSEAWTAGFDYEPAVIDGARVSLTYFDITFDDRIGVPPGALPDVLTDPAYSSVRDFTPDIAVIAPYFNSPYPYFFDQVGVSGPEDIEAVVDLRPQNLSSTHVNGIDAEMQYVTGLAGGDLALSLNANYIFEFAQLTAPGLPELDLAGTANRPVNLRLRFNALWSSGDWVLGGDVNYADGYDDPNSTPVRSVDSHLTTDLMAAWTSPSQSGLASGLRLSLHVRNVFDEDPPFVNQPLGYDAANADPYGRTFTVSLSKAW